LTKAREPRAASARVALMSVPMPMKMKVMPTPRP
jgi:hypothetical protein